jgi:hypothetical protein
VLGGAAAAGYGVALSPAEAFTKGFFDTTVPDGIRAGAPAAGSAGGAVGGAAGDGVKSSIDDSRASILASMSSIIATIKSTAASADPTVGVDVVGPSQAAVNAVAASIQASIPRITATIDAVAGSLPSFGGWLGGNAYGGIIDEPTATWVAEAGHPEAIIPLDPALEDRAWDLLGRSGLVDVMAERLGIANPDNDAPVVQDMTAALTGNRVGAGSPAEVRHRSSSTPTSITNNFDLSGRQDDEQQARRIIRRIEGSFRGLL